jgi:glycosyltransferase involved in cell wall biosynthesis
MNPKNNRILLCFQHFRTPRDMGGLRSWHIGRKLAKEGFEVEAVIPAVDTLYGSRRWHGLRLSKTEEIDGVKVHWVASLANNRRSKISRILYFLSSSLSQLLQLGSMRRPGLVVSMSLPLSSLIISLIYARFCKVPFVVDVRDTHIDSALATGYVRPGPFVRFLQEIEALAFKCADLNIAVTKGMGQILEQKGVPANRLKVIPLGYDGADCYQGYVDWSRDIRKELDLEGKFVALYSGTLGYVFDLDTILLAAEHLKDQKDIVFLFAGTGQRFEELKSKSENKGLNTIFLGQRPKQDIPLLCRQADAALYAVRDKKPLKAIMGNKIFDYLGNGTPIINASKGGDVDNLIESAKAGISVKSGDAEGMAKAISHLKNNSEEKLRLGSNAEIYINQYMTAEKFMESFSDEIRQIMTGK